MVGKLAMPTMKCLSPFLTIKPPPILLFKKFYKILILNNKTNKNYKPISLLQNEFCWSLRPAHNWLFGLKS